MRIIRRTYKNKQGKLITKTYTYEHQSTKGKILVNKKGQVYKKNVDALKKGIDNNAEYSEAEKRSLKADLDAFVKQRSKEGKKLTTTGFSGHIAEDEISRMFSNLGYSVDEAADMLGVSAGDLLDQKNWNDGNFIAATGLFKINWTYTGNIWQQI